MAGAMQQDGGPSGVSRSFRQDETYAPSNFSTLQHKHGSTHPLPVSRRRASESGLSSLPSVTSQHKVREWLTASPLPVPAEGASALGSTMAQRPSSSEPSPARCGAVRARLCGGSATWCLPRQPEQCATLKPLLPRIRSQPARGAPAVPPSRAPLHRRADSRGAPPRLAGRSWQCRQ